MGSGIGSLSRAAPQSPPSGAAGQPVRRWLAVVLLATLMCCAPHGAHGFYLPGSYPQEWVYNTTTSVKVRSLTSSQTELPYAYYSLPFCKPEGGVEKLAENLGELLMGERVESSPYAFNMMVEQRMVEVCTIELDARSARDTQNKIEDNYRVHMTLDSLPVTDSSLEGASNNYLHDRLGGTVQTGFPVGYYAQEDDDGQKDGEQKDRAPRTRHFLHNHLAFNVLVNRMELTDQQQEVYEEYAREKHPASTSQKPAGVRHVGWMIVGFEVVPCSVLQRGSLARADCDGTSPQAVLPGQNVTYSYSVRWTETNTTWLTRWDAYLRTAGDQDVHWFSILNSFFVTCFLAGMVFIILLRTIRNDLADDALTGKEELALMGGGSGGGGGGDSVGWKLVSGDVFRPPPWKETLCCLVGGGVQIALMALTSVGVAALGFLSPESHGALLTAMVVIYLLLGFVTGHTAVSLLCMMGPPSAAHTRWALLSIKAACGFPAAAALLLAVINTALATTHSTGVIPFSLFFSLFVLWFLISVPLSVLGGWRAHRAYLDVDAPPMRSNQIARQVPDAQLPSDWIVLAAGVFPFGTAFIELYFVMSSLWRHQTYYIFGFLLIVLILTLIVAAEISVVLTYLFLCFEDYRWWWRSFFAGGATAFFVLVYSVVYVTTGLLGISSAVGLITYVGYMLIVVVGVWLMCGAVSFLASLAFCRLIYSALKSD